MYTGMADVAALTGDSGYIKAIDKIWSNIINKKMYITGGIGSTSSGEAFGENYELPNMSAYCETCAAIGNVYMNYRLFLLHGDGKYFDVLERSLYNGLISGVSLDGGGFFYPNPLESIGQHQRQAWFGCACCPSNICRFIPSVPGYVYAVHENNVYVNLFMSNTSSITVAGKKLQLAQSTTYPWNGDVKVNVTPAGTQKFNLKIRIPGWVRGQVVPGDLYSYTDRKSLAYSIKVNGKEVSSAIEKGYFTVNRAWKKGDVVEIHFDMEPRTVKANEKVAADRGKIAIERGPVVYCAEWPDNDFSVLSVVMPRKPAFSVVSKPDLLFGINQIKTDAQVLSYNEAGKIIAKDVHLTLIPYYAWCHRGSGEMAVWLPNELSATRPSMPASIASESKISASQMMKAITAINDRLLPKSGDDHSVPYYHWWPKNNTTEWIVYDFKAAQKVNHTGVYWYDDSPWGGCRVPQSWKVYYKTSDGQWLPVEAQDAYGVQRGVMNEVQFKAVTTTALKLEVQLPEKNSTGIFEWEVE